MADGTIYGELAHTLLLNFTTSHTRMCPPCSLPVDLEVQMLQQAESFLLAPTNGQTQH